MTWPSRTIAAPTRGFGLGRPRIASAIACAITSRSKSDHISILELRELVDELSEYIAIPANARLSDLRKFTIEKREVPKVEF